jgi:hypothetical protein
MVNDIIPAQTALLDEFFNGISYVRIMAHGEIDTEEALEMVETLIALKRKELARRKASVSSSTTNADSADAKDHSQAARSGASVSLMITQGQKAALHECGYTDEQIHDMKPGDAHRVLGLVN